MSLQDEVAQSNELHFKGTTLSERLRDLQHQMAELAHAPDARTRAKEIGDVGWALLQLSNDEGLDFEFLVRRTIRTLERRVQHKVALIGTSANPITNGHITLGLEILAMTDVDEVWYLIVGDHPWGKKLMPAEHRLEMARLATARYPKLKVCDFEIAHASEIGRRETASVLRDFLLPAFPTYQFFWVMGSDVVLTFDQWEGHEWMADNIRMIVVHRTGYDWQQETDPVLAGEQHLYLKEGIAMSNISSSLVRERANADRILGLVPESVSRYLSEHNLLEAP